MGLPLLLCPELICRVLICRVPNGGWSRSLDAPSAPPQHRCPIVLQAFSRTKLVEAAALAARSLCQVRSCWLRSATMRANAISFRFEAGLRFCRCLSSQLEPVVMLLNDEVGRQQSLKGLLVQRQVGTVRGHGIWGRRTVQTEVIVVQVWAVLNTKEDG